MKLMSRLSCVMSIMIAYQLSAEPSATPRITELATMEDFDAIGTEKKPTITEVYAEWCGACKSAAKDFEDTSTKFPQVKFYRLNVDKLPEAAKKKNVKALPTFILSKPGSEEIQIAGNGDLPSALAQFIKK